MEEDGIDVSPINGLLLLFNGFLRFGDEGTGRFEIGGSGGSGSD